MANETQAKYHHLIPQTYMSAWANSSGTLQVEFLDNPGTIILKNKEHIAGYTDFHSIRAGMPICTLQDATEIFASVANFDVVYDGKIIKDPLELNKIYWDFDNWVINRNNGSPVSKKKIKNEIEQVKIKDIESNWSTKYENKWRDEINTIQQQILTATQTEIPAFDKDYIMKFFVALNWRGFQSNKQFEDIAKLLCCSIGKLDEISIPKELRELPILKTAADEMRHDLLLSYYRKYLNDDGVIYQAAIVNMEHTSFHFLIADGMESFITSDSPAFVCQREDGQLLGLLAITPKILMVQGRKSSLEESDIYCVSHITDMAVLRYNSLIRENATEFVIHI